MFGFLFAHRHLFLRVWYVDAGLQQPASVWVVPVSVNDAEENISEWAAYAFQSINPEEAVKTHTN